jgi:hypothetical protein
MRSRQIFPWKKRFRGARRYYEALQVRAETFSLDLREGHWFDLWHEHFDFDGHGRRGVKHRREHLAALLTAFQRAVRQARESGHPLQVFASIAPETQPEQDALYVHSPNPHGTPFPHPFKDTTWDAKVPTRVPGLREFLLSGQWELGSRSVEGEMWYVIREKAHAP